MRKVRLRYWNDVFQEPAECNGYKIGGVFGVHLTQRIAGSGVEDGDTWNVTHLPTGHALLTVWTMAAALRVAKTLTSDAWRRSEWVFGAKLPRPLPVHALTARDELNRVKKLVLTSEDYA